MFVSNFAIKKTFKPSADFEAFRYSFYCSISFKVGMVVSFRRGY